MKPDLSLSFNIFHNNVARKNLHKNNMLCHLKKKQIAKNSFQWFFKFKSFEILLNNSYY